MMRSSHSDKMYDRSLWRSPLLAMSTQLLPMLSCSHLRHLQSTVQLKIGLHRRFNKFQRNRFHRNRRLFANLLCIERLPLPPFIGYRESENLYVSDSDRDNTACHFVVRFPSQDQLISISPDPNNFNCPIYSHHILEYGSPCSSTYDISCQPNCQNP